MKKLNYLALGLIAVFALSCSNDDDPPPPPIADPVVQAPTGTTVQVNQSVDLTFNVTAAGLVGEVTVAATAGEAAITSPSIVGESTGTVVVSYTAPLTDGTQSVSLTVTDSQTTPKSTKADAGVAVTLAAESSTELLVAKFASAPTFDGEIDDLWNTAQKLVSSVTVPSGEGARDTYYNEAGIDEDLLDIFEAYESESYDFTMRSGQDGTDIYFLIEWDDAVDSKDRQSWFFDADTKLWKQEHKYANATDDKFYEDKFAFLFPIGTVDNFSTQTCYATCHGNGGVADNPKDKHTRHYLKTDGQKIDMWHWKRVRGTHNDRVDDQRITYKAPPYSSATNGRSGDADGGSGYSDNKVKLLLTGGVVGVDSLTVPKYVVPDGTDYYWITIEQTEAGGDAKLVTAVDANGVLTYDGGTIDPTDDAGYAQGDGTKRFPSIITRDFTGARADIEIKVNHNGSGWVAELKRKLNTGDDDDVVFDPAEELPFGFAIFNNAAIAHGIKPGLLMKYEQ